MKSVIRVEKISRQYRASVRAREPHRCDARRFSTRLRGRLRRSRFGTVYYFTRARTVFSKTTTEKYAFMRLSERSYENLKPYVNRATYEHFTAVMWGGEGYYSQR
jgi:hypothetical protein